MLTRPDAIDCYWFVVFSPTAKLAMGSLAQNSSGAIRCSCNTRFRRRFRSLPVQIANEVPEGSRGFRSLPVHIANEVPDGSGADSREGSGGFRGGWLMRFWRVRVQMADEVPESSGADSGWGSEGFRHKNLPRSSKLLGSHMSLFCCLSIYSKHM